MGTTPTTGLYTCWTTNRSASSFFVGLVMMILWKEIAAAKPLRRSSRLLSVAAQGCSWKERYLPRSHPLAFLHHPPQQKTSFFHSSSLLESPRQPSRVRRLSAKKSKKKKGVDEVFRADRVLSQRTQKPRSECFDLLKQRRVWLKPGDTGNDEEDWESIPGPSSKLTMDTPLWIDRTHAVPMPPPLIMAYHKPKWVLSVTSDVQLQRPCLDETIVPTSMHPVGRLDYDSSGLLLFSSSGPLTQRLLHPKHAIPKVYQTIVTDRVDAEKLGEQLSSGVTTGEGVHTADLLSVEHFPQEDVAPYLQSVQSNLPTHYNQTDLKQRGYLDIFEATALSTVTLRVREGKHRMVRRMLANCGHPVVTLTRLQLGEINLDDLPEGSQRRLTDTEEAWIRAVMP
jgi:pseudouridine synthase